MNHPVLFVDWDNKTRLVPALFSSFSELSWEEIKISLKIVIAIRYQEIKK